ncbi:MAG: prolipoprotein diacylglyceryl transferase [Dehalococcoidia bacterium]|nr:prolipoprotein diacylglyceryl transferase [Dehalococcoidia bacterium]
MADPRAYRWGSVTRTPWPRRCDRPACRACLSTPYLFYEALYNVALFLFLNALALGGAREGAPTAFYLVLYGAGRFGLESLRYNTVSDKMGPLLRNQWLSLAMIVPGLVLLTQDGPDPTFVTPGLWELMALIPVLAVSSFLVFLAYSLHRGRLGRW